MPRGKRIDFVDITPAHNMLSSVEGVIKQEEITYDEFGPRHHKAIIQPKNSLSVRIANIKIKGHQKIRKIIKGTIRVKRLRKYTWNSK